ncbi:flagellar motor switch protein FliN [Nocardioides anomalus]|uniref:Flagellar motor switch protein FliN n=1 Tax=Nocardioides anomalus TaxID=2712223 RepID=A0A6G6WBH4_9ACTN|nr:flagellar motor switch protein FliN [Nocardioides anomalus]QIG42455.1 flagellar motor switch protein FliN [Nocardioides anomalus]
MTTTPLAAPAEHLALAAGEAAAAVLPAADLLTASTTAPAGPDIAAPYAGAVVAALAGGLDGTVALLVGQELVHAVESGPGIDLAGAAQPALDAVGAVLGGSAQVGRVVPAALALAQFAGPCTAVTLTDGRGPAAVLLVSDGLLASGAPSLPAPAPVAAPAAAPAAGSPAGRLVGSSRGLEVLHGVDMEVTVELGRSRLTVRELLALAPGQVLELDRAAGSPADLLVNGLLIARGEVVVVDEDFGLRITEIVDESVAS